jgi:hypothetical protein
MWGLDNKVLPLFSFLLDSDGTISLVDFVRSVDNVYKELRLLQATIDGSTKIDKGMFEHRFGAFDVVSTIRPLPVSLSFLVQRWNPFSTTLFTLFLSA